MKKTRLLIIVIGLILFIIGMILKMAKWPKGSLIVILGLMFSVTGIISRVINYYKRKRSKEDNSVLEEI
ncbi:MAG: hypothetical protein CMP61_02160 [Flavobacteriales bacterium]|nr:hypothetical protein [Flavobacteriales bacterium]|tara:strand:- start:3731 stop:3937 length:207 start_codon:yes stop_codon:yes gene_type:complete